MESFIGFHGTSKKNSKKILNSKKFNPSSNCGDNLMLRENDTFKRYHWLGNGIYFWDEDYDLCKLWADIQFKNKKSILMVPIQCEKNRIFDLLKNQEHKKQIDTLIFALMESDVIDLRKAKIEDLEKKENYKIVGFVIDYYFKKQNPEYDMVYYAFMVESNSQCIPFFPKLTPQICVKNDDIIVYDKLCEHTI